MRLTMAAVFLLIGCTAMPSHQHGQSLHISELGLHGRTFCAMAYLSARVFYYSRAHLWSWTSRSTLMKPRYSSTESNACSMALWSRTIHATVFVNCSAF